MKAVATPSGPSTVRDRDSRRLPTGEPYLVLTRLVVGAGILLVTVAVAAGPLAFSGLWNPWTAGISFCVAVLLAMPFTSFDLPAPPRSGTLCVGLVGIGGAFTTWAALTSAENVIVRRDAASYFQTALALTSTNTTPFPVDPVVGELNMLGIPGLGLGSPGFFEVGSASSPAIEPQFLIGVTSWYSIGYWLGGANGAWLLAAAVGGLALVSLGVLLSLLVPPAETVIATAGVALTFPLLHVSRSTYSEQFGLLAVVCSLTVIALALRQELDAKASRLGLIAGLLFGGATMFRIDSLREIALLLPVAAWLTVRREAVGRPLLRGVGVGLLVGIVYWLWLSRHYLAVNLESVRPALLVLVASAVVSLGSILAASRGRGVPPTVHRWLPLAIASMVAAFFVFLVSRPAWWVTRGRNEGARLGQEREGLPLDPTRLYAENSVEWSAWWVGWPTVIVAMCAAVYLTFRTVTVLLDSDSPPPLWIAPFVVGLGSAILVWFRPGINPDHPWADRRLVLLLPVVLALATWAVGAASRRLPTTIARRAGLVACATLIVVPPALATTPFATERVGSGTLASVEAGCDYFEPSDVVLAVDGLSAFYWPQTIRGMCGVPVLMPDISLITSPDSDESLNDIIDALSARLAGTDRELVLVSTDEGSLQRQPDGAFPSPRQIIRLATTMDDSTVTVRPSPSQPVLWELWASRDER